MKGKSLCVHRIQELTSRPASCKAVFVDTDQVPGRESRVGTLIQNEVEAQLVCQVCTPIHVARDIFADGHKIIEALLLCSIDQSQIGIISLYRQQTKLLSHLLLDYKGIEVLTADRSQGRDKDCIIISMVKSNADGQVSSAIHLVHVFRVPSSLSPLISLDWRST